VRRFVLLLALLVCAGCAHYAVLAEGPIDERAVRGLSPIFATDIQFAFPQVWESPDEWARHVAAWNEAYLAGLAKAGRDVGNRGIQHLPPGAVAPQGLVVAATVREIRRGEVIMTDKMVGIIDKIVVDVAFIEASARRPVLTTTLEVKSTRMAGPEGYTFGGRIKFACLNLADAIAAALREGRFTP
jgi:hypothetical protein